MCYVASDPYSLLLCLHLWNVPLNFAARQKVQDWRSGWENIKNESQKLTYYLGVWKNKTKLSISNQCRQGPASRTEEILLCGCSLGNCHLWLVEAVASTTPEEKFVEHVGHVFNLIFCAQKKLNVEWHSQGFFFSGQDKTKNPKQPDYKHGIRSLQQPPLAHLPQ